MPTTVTIAIFGLGVGLAAGTVSLLSSPASRLSDSLRHKLIDVVAHRPRLAGFVRRRLDRTQAGGLLLTGGLLTVGILATTVGVVLEAAVSDSRIAGWDLAVAEYGSRNAELRAADFYAALTHLGGTPGVIAVTVAVSAWGWWRFQTVQVAMFMATVAAGQAVISTGLKTLVGRERPDLLHLAPWSGSSFPSGHAAAAAAVFAASALVLSHRRRRLPRALIGAGAGVLIGVVAATRALLGVHWLTDVIAGVAVGLAWFVVVAVAFGGTLMRFGQPRDQVALAAAARGAS
ncbi:MAG: phosphatase PAP2 family protein [Acidimicrobiia bacterium]